MDFGSIGWAGHRWGGLLLSGLIFVGLFITLFYHLVRGIYCWQIIKFLKFLCRTPNFIWGFRSTKYRSNIGYNQRFTSTYVVGFLYHIKVTNTAVTTYRWNPLNCFACLLSPVALVLHSSSSAASITGWNSCSGSSPLSSSKRLCFLSSLSFRMTWGSDKNTLTYILTKCSVWIRSGVSEWTYLFERSGFLGFGHLSLLAFLHQRAGGVQGIVGNFILLPGWLLLD